MNWSFVAFLSRPPEAHKREYVETWWNSTSVVKSIDKMTIGYIVSIRVSMKLPQYNDHCATIGQFNRLIVVEWEILHEKSSLIFRQHIHKYNIHGRRTYCTSHIYCTYSNLSCGLDKKAQDWSLIDEKRRSSRSFINWRFDAIA